MSQNDFCESTGQNFTSCESESASTSTGVLNLRNFRPRGTLARALYEKQIADDYLSNFDRNEVSFK